MGGGYYHWARLSFHCLGSACRHHPERLLVPSPPPFSFLLPTVKNVKYPLAFSYYRQEKAIPSVGFVLLFLIVIATENGWAYSPRQGEWRHLYNF